MGRDSELSITCNDTCNACLKLLVHQAFFLEASNKTIFEIYVIMRNIFYPIKLIANEIFKLY